MSKLAQRISGEHTITNYKGVSCLNFKVKQKKVFCKAMLLSKSEQEKLDKIRAECGLTKSPITIQNKTEKTLAITTAIVSLITIVTALLPLPFLIPAILSAVTMLTALLTAIKITKQNQQVIEQKENDDKIIKFELSERQHKYRDALEN
ncbi:hypothetical protein BGL67_05015 [Helicobacter pylori]|uniref:hypothetical protein n=1 Tax=Helicobacter pylori TaxID=210 RepID=UPI0009A29C61|nr:hypothetical protein [Helicobacter pylori]NHA59209.1 hypothetical protein [Helicobacter pylori]OPG34930.1 hypothetical protein BGL67_05015 [Helicobacter pylori]